MDNRLEEDSLSDLLPSFAKRGLERGLPLRGFTLSFLSLSFCNFSKDYINSVTSLPSFSRSLASLFASFSLSFLSFLVVFLSYSILETSRSQKILPQIYFQSKIPQQQFHLQIDTLQLLLLVSSFM